MRRNAAPWILGLAAVVLVVCVLADTLRPHAPEGTEQEAHTRQLIAMDTVMSFTAYGPNAEEALDAVLADIQRLDALLSTGNPQSEVSRLNASGTLAVSEDTHRLFEAASAIYRDTGGLFDCTIYPLMELWGFPEGVGRTPSGEELTAALPLVDGGRPTLSGDVLTLGEGQKLDFGGIAKGYTAERAMELFRAYGVTSAMVNLGGNIQVLGTTPEGTPWRIGVRDPESATGGALAVIPASEMAVVTSGGYERFFEADGQRYIHILDPRTGRPAATDLLSATVAASDGTLADGLSTAVFVMGVEEAAAFWRERSGSFELVLVDTSGTLYVTEGLEKVIETSRPVTVIRP